MDKLSEYEIFDMGNLTWRIVERGVVNIYLLVGKSKALVIDTGYGNIDLLTRIKELTDLPFIVLNTHGHPDHSGGNNQFNEIYANSIDTELIRSYAQNDKLPIVPLYDEQIIDLGERKVKVIFTPGHTAGSISLFDAKTNFLFTSDTCNRMTWVFQVMGIEFNKYYNSLLKLKPYLDLDITICPGHNLPEDKTLLKDCITCAELINKDPTGTPYHADGWGDGLAKTFGIVTIVFNPNKM